MSQDFIIAPNQTCRTVLLSLLIVASLMASSAIKAEGYLEAEELAGIGAASLGTVWLGHTLRQFDTTKTPVISEPFPGERSIQEFLGGEYTPGKTNFLDSKFGASITPVVAATTLLGANLKWSRGESEKDAAQDLFLFVGGLIATRGITDISKGFFGRPRPFTVWNPDERTYAPGQEFRWQNSSFFSGHSSGAFFSVSYLNLRLRSVMRNEMSSDEYRDWRWAPPAVLYGWATFVAWSRIHAYKHYLSDVSFGALAGYLIAELFYSFNDDIHKETGKLDSSPVVFKITLKSW